MKDQELGRVRDRRALCVAETEQTKAESVKETKAELLERSCSVESAMTRLSSVESNQVESGKLDDKPGSGGFADGDVVRGGKNQESKRLMRRLERPGGRRRETLGCVRRRREL